MKVPILSALLTLLLFSFATGQTTSFTYQGKLSFSGAPANGNFDLEFRLFDTATGGSQIGGVQTRTNVAVADGIFTVTLDFGGQFPGTTRFLDISVREAGGSSFTALAPRHLITSSPYSVQTLNAQMLGGVPATQYVQTNDARLADARPPTAGSTNYIQNGTSAQTANFNVNGSGTAGNLSVGTTVSMNGSAAPAVAPMGQGRIYFDGTSRKFRLSENGGAYFDLAGSGGVSGSGTVNSIPLWSGGTAIGNSLISQSGTSVLMPNVATFGNSPSGHFAQMGSPNSESGLTFSGTGARADIRYNGTLKIVNGPGGVVGPANGISIATTGNVSIGGAETATGKLQVFGGSGQPGIFSQTDNRALWGVSTGSGYGVYGESTNGIGVQGKSSINIGTVGESVSNTGVYGNTQAGNAANPGVRGISTGTGGVGVRGDGTTGVYGTSATGTGVTGESSSPTGYGVYATSSTNRAIFAQGNALQARDRSGFAKAHILVDPFQLPVNYIQRCYNGSTNSSTGNCGFSVTRTGIGTYVVDFGFQVNDRFLSLTAVASSIGSTGQQCEVHVLGTFQVSVYCYEAHSEPIQLFEDKGFFLTVF